METTNMAKYCKKCGNEIHPKRVEILPTATTCVKCSDTKAKRSITVQLGEGDHTYNELIIMDADEYQKLEPYINPRTVSTPSLDKIEEIEENTPTPEEKNDDDVSVWDGTLLDGLDDLEKEEDGQSETFD
jgi:hypothetical protein